MSRSAAKLGRRSRKMREMISEAVRTIEDSQSAQAVHGLLSLKADSTNPGDFPSLLKAVGQQMGGSEMGSLNDRLGQGDMNYDEIVTTKALARAAAKPGSLNNMPGVTGIPPHIAAQTPPQVLQMLYHMQEQQRQQMKQLQNSNQESHPHMDIPQGYTPRAQGSFQQSHKEEYPQNMRNSFAQISSIQTKMDTGGMVGVRTMPHTSKHLDNLAQVYPHSPPAHSRTPTPASEQHVPSPNNLGNRMDDNFHVRNPVKKRPYPPQSPNSPGSPMSMNIDDHDVRNSNVIHPRLNNENQTGSADCSDNIGSLFDVSSSRASNLFSSSSIETDFVNQMSEEEKNIHQMLTEKITNAFTEVFPYTFDKVSAMREALKKRQMGTSPIDAMINKVVCDAISENDDGNKIMIPTAAGMPLTMPDPQMGEKMWKGFQVRLNDVIKQVVSFAKKVPGFVELHTEDQINLIKGGCFEVACVVHAAFIDEESNSMYILGNNMVVTRQQLKAGFILGEKFIELMFNFSIRLNSFRLTNAEMSLFSALMIISPDRQCLRQRQMILKAQERLLQTLQLNIQRNHPNDYGIFPRLLMMMSNIRELNVEHKQILQSIMEKGGEVPIAADELHSELMDLNQQ